MVDLDTVTSMADLLHTALRIALIMKACRSSGK